MKKYLLLILLMSSCASYRKQQQRAEQFYKTYPNELAKLCAYAFPPHTELKQGRDTITQTDTLQVAVNCPPSSKDTLVYTKYLQKTKLRVDTLYKTRTAVEDSLRLSILTMTGEKQTLTEQKQAAETKYNSLMLTLTYIGMGLIGLVVLVLALKSFKVF